MAPFSLSLFPSVCLFFSLLFPIEFAASSADQQKRNLDKFFTKFADELPPNERSADTLALFAEMDEADALLTDQMSKVIPPPPSPAHPTFQTLYLDKNKGPNSAEKNSAFQSDPKSAVVRRLKGSKLSKLRSLFPRTKFMKQTERIVKVYLKLKDNPGGGWGPLIQKMFGEMILAKKLGKGDGASLRANCQLALELIGEGDGATEAMVDQLAKAKPYSNFWTLTKRTTKAILCLLKGNGTESERQRSTEDILRMLKTFAEDGESLKMVQKGGKREADKAGVIRDSRYRKISNSRLPPPVHGKGKNRRRRRKRQLTILVLFGIILAGVAICAMICKLFAKKGSAEG